MNYARFSDSLSQILKLCNQDQKTVSQRHVDALGAWLALRVTGRVILPMAISAGSFVQMRRFDWSEDDIPNRIFMQALPNIYAAWCHAVLDAVEQVVLFMREELEQYFQDMKMTRAGFIDAISHTTIAACDRKLDHCRKAICSGCGDDYTALDHGLVDAAQIAIEKCTDTGHSFDCMCESFDQATSVVVCSDFPAYSSKYDQSGHVADTTCNEKFSDATYYMFEGTVQSNTFSNVATLLYRAQGRVWNGRYSIREKLCGTCFLIREHYIGDDGMSVDFSPMPRSFETIGVRR